MNKLNVFIADDHSIVRQGIRLLIDSQPDMQVIGEAGDGEEACRQVREMKPDVVVMDVSMPKLNGAQATERLRVTTPTSRILALSAYSDEAHVRQLLASGAAGYVLKRAIAEELTAAIRTVAGGGVHLDPTIAGKVVGGYINPASEAGSDSGLTAREQEILILVAWGHSNKEIAAQLHLSVKTIEGHKTRLMDKLGLQSRADLVRFALRRGWLKED